MTCKLRAVTKPARMKAGGLRLGPLVAVMFFTVSGGPFGLEGLVGSVGPGVAVLLLVATPLVYSVPEALLIGELASMLPVEGGYYQWVKRAVGRFWGFWNGWLSWAYSLIDMAIYPVLLLQYLHFFLPGLRPLDGWLLALALIWGATWLNLRGTRVVGTASGWFVALVLAPFGVLAAVALARWIGQPATPFPVTPFHAAGTSFLGALGLGVSQSIWNYSGWDNQSTVGGEIEDASATYPRALARAARRASPCSSRPSCIRVSRCCRSAGCSRPTCCSTPRRWRSSSPRCCGCGAWSRRCAAGSVCRSASVPWGCSRPSRCCCSRWAWRSRCEPARPGCPAWSWPCRSPRWALRCTWSCARAVRGSAPRPSPGSGRRGVFPVPRRDSRASLRTLGMARNIAGAVRFPVATAAILRN